MNDWKTAVNTKTAELIGKGYRPALASKCALKACRHLHPQAKQAAARTLAHADARFEATGKVDSYNAI